MMNPWMRRRVEELVIGGIWALVFLLILSLMQMRVISSDLGSTLIIVSIVLVAVAGWIQVDRRSRRAKAEAARTPAAKPPTVKR